MKGCCTPGRLGGNPARFERQQTLPGVLERTRGLGMDCYEPPSRHRPRYFSPFGWLLVAAGSVLAVAYGIGGMWLLAALLGK